MSGYAKLRFLLVKTAALLAPIALAVSATSAAHAATTDPLQLLYLFPGATDNGGTTNAGVASSVSCYSFSATSETIQYIVRNFDSALKANVSSGLNTFQTGTASTHATNLYTDGAVLGTGVLDQGMIAVLATSINIVCEAQVIDAAAAGPSGFALHGMRFNAYPGTQE
jgi:hypothetical protein